MRVGGWVLRKRTDEQRKTELRPSPGLGRNGECSHKQRKARHVARTKDACYSKVRPVTPEAGADRPRLAAKGAEMQRKFPAISM